MKKKYFFTYEGEESSESLQSLNTIKEDAGVKVLLEDDYFLLVLSRKSVVNRLKTVIGNDWNIIPSEDLDVDLF